MPFFYLDSRVVAEDCWNSLDGFMTSTRGVLRAKARLTGLQVRRLLSRCRRMLLRARAAVGGARVKMRSEDRRSIIKQGKITINGFGLIGLTLSFIAGADVGLGSFYDGNSIIFV